MRAGVGKRHDGTVVHACHFWIVSSIHRNDTGITFPWYRSARLAHIAAQPSLPLFLWVTKEQLAKTEVGNATRATSFLFHGCSMSTEVNSCTMGDAILDLVGLTLKHSVEAHLTEFFINSFEAHVRPN